MINKLQNSDILNAIQTIDIEIDALNVEDGISYTYNREHLVLKKELSVVRFLIVHMLTIRKIVKQSK